MDRRIARPLVVVPIVSVAVVVGAEVASLRDPMRQGATAFLDSLSPEHRAQAQLDFEDPNRLDWHYIPRERRGLAIKDMTESERLAAHNLLRSTLSSRGYLKATSIMELDQVLREMAEVRGQRADYRDPSAYFFTIFGDPTAGDAAPWGWRVEGHHLSLNFSSATGEVAITPAFLGANPAEVREGRRAGLRVLAQEEDLARGLLATLDGDQRALALVETDVPADILLSPGAEIGVLGQDAGLSLADMREDQRALVALLIAEWAGNLRPGLAAEQLQRIDDAGREQIRFLWIGAERPGRPHYYRLRGPTFVIEYDCTQDDANHIHTVWRDPERDFGANLLRDHLQHDHPRH